MRITSIISEYNPFHQGHKYHMENTKKITNSDYTIVLMSGNFTQRGTPTIIDKYARTKQALLCGADLVLELPVCFATASAEGFAFGAVSILEKLGVIDSFVFGSESGNIDTFKNVADFLVNEPLKYKERLQFFLKQGFSFPKARANALEVFFSDLDKGFFASSNNILGIEYCRALKYFNSSITPMTIVRKDNLYNDTELSVVGKLSSATAIRKVLLGKEFYKNGNEQINQTNMFDVLSHHLPPSCLEILKENRDICMPVSSNDFSLLLKYKLLLENRNSLTQYVDVSSDLADRIYNNLNLYKDFESFCEILKTKELTYTRIARSLLHILLDIKKEDYSFLSKVNIENGSVQHGNSNWGQYARILGFRKEASPLLHEIKKHSSIPLADPSRYLFWIVARPIRPKRLLIPY